MNFPLLLSKLKCLNLPEREFAVVASGSLAVRGIREARDLDLVVTDTLWDDLEKGYGKIVENNKIHKIILDPSIEIIGEGSCYNDPQIATFNDIITSADIIDGVRYINIPLLKRFKEKIGREKDLQDIELIDNYINSYYV